jgi:hypothetical protein
MVHEGSFDDLDQTYGALGTYVSEHGIGLPGPIREHYATTDRAEVCWPIDGRPATSWTRAPSPNERPARSCEGRTGRRRGARANASARASRRARPWRPPPDVQRSRHAGGSRPEAISTSSTLVRRAPRSELAHTRRAAPRDYVQNSATERHRPERATATDRRICRRSATERDAPIDPSGGQPGAVTTAAPTRIVTNRPPTGRHVCRPLASGWLRLGSFELYQMAMNAAACTQLTGVKLQASEIVRARSFRDDGAFRTTPVPLTPVNMGKFRPPWARALGQ